MKLFLRYGGHAEKRYFEKMIRFFDGIIFQANLLESTPAAVVSLISRFCGANMKLAHIVDPVTHSFGEYYDPKTQQTKNDMYWIASQNRKGETAIKSSYAKLADALGGKFQASVASRQAITLEDLEDDVTRKSICKGVISYQHKRIPDMLQSEKEFAPFVDDLPKPAIIFAPYFFIAPNNYMKWLDVMDAVTSDSMEHENSSLHVKLCFDKSTLLNKEATNKIFKICEKNFKGVWLWMDDFDETDVNSDLLKLFGGLVKGLSERGKDVYNRHGGFYSIMLSKFGMTGVSSGVGYGEHRGIMPVLGRGFPSVNYYFPSLHKKLSVINIESAFGKIGIESEDDFFTKICDCVVCKGVIEDDIFNFRKFGTRHFATPRSKQKTQTQAAASRARFHYLLNRLTERKCVTEHSPEKLLQLIQEKSLPLSKIDTLKARHIPKWVEAYADTVSIIL